MPHFRAVSSVPTFGWARGGAPGPVEQVPRASNGYYKANVRVCERQPRFSTIDKFAVTRSGVSTSQLYSCCDLAAETSATGSQQALLSYDQFPMSWLKLNTLFFHVKVDQTVAGDRHIAGENNGRFFGFEVAEKFYQINTNNFHSYDHA